MDGFPESFPTPELSDRDSPTARASIPFSFFLSPALFPFFFFSFCVTLLLSFR